ncbi:NUDIX domain-containing protein [Nonomuraea sp. NPDC050536]|uniref:NUDIX domain-containing protein n=1 Tax=Nonomuraea sp. NPDC050536 TaxID=3364366 RepID=UPI0037C9BAD7
MNRTYTHPDVFDRGVREGWAEPETDPARIDWDARQAAAAIPFQVVDGRPVNPCHDTGITHGRNELGHWGEQLCADAVVIGIAHDGTRRLVMVERADGHGWALPGGYVDAGEEPVRAAVRELAEETGLELDGAVWQALQPRYVSDPRASNESWMVTVPVVTTIRAAPGADLPRPVGADDARRAAWVQVDTYAKLVSALQTTYRGHVFAAHQHLLQDLLG